jgi:predicted AAA+ superfamily ATPase
MNYISYLREARLINLLYEKGEEQSKKPAKVYNYNSNQIYAINLMRTEDLAIYETFFFNQLQKDNEVNAGDKNAQFLINGKYSFQLTADLKPGVSSDIYQVVEKLETGEGNLIPLWLFGFLY